MKGHRAGLLLVAMVVLLSSCVSSGPVGASPAPTTTSAVAPQPSRDPLAGVSTPPWASATIGDPVPVASVPGDVSMHWVFISLSDDGRGVRIIYVGGDGWCFQSGGILITETALSVTITTTGTARKDATVCPASLKQRAGTVSLAAALGQRALIHAAVSERWKDVMPLG